MDKATAKTTTEIPVFLLKALFNEERIINPESQNTGIETKIPVKFIASGDFLSPISFNIYFAIVDVPPDFSMNVPIIAPNPMMIPILDKVFPNPSLILSIMIFPSKPIKNPTITEAIIKVINGCILNLAIATIIKTRIAKIIRSKFIKLRIQE